MLAGSSAIHMQFCGWDNGWNKLKYRPIHEKTGDLRRGELSNEREKETNIPIAFPLFASYFFSASWSKCFSCKQVCIRRARLYWQFVVSDFRRVYRACWITQVLYTRTLLLYILAFETLSDSLDSHTRISQLTYAENKILASGERELFQLFTD